jgi:hypothetical protein
LRFTHQQLAICQKYAFKPEGVNLGETLTAEAPVSLPIDPEVLADEYVTDKCKFMDSASDDVRAPGKAGGEDRFDAAEAG